MEAARGMIRIKVYHPVLWIVTSFHSVILRKFSLKKPSQFNIRRLGQDNRFAKKFCLFEPGNESSVI